MCPAKPEFCVKSQAESADDSGDCVSALSGLIGTPDPTTTKPNRQLDGGEEKQHAVADQLMILGFKWENAWYPAMLGTPL